MKEQSLSLNLIYNSMSKETEKKEDLKNKNPEDNQNSDAKKENQESLNDMELNNPVEEIEGREEELEDLNNSIAGQSIFDY